MASALNPEKLAVNNKLKHDVIARIGWLNCWTPLFAEGWYIVMAYVVMAIGWLNCWTPLFGEGR